MLILTRNVGSRLYIDGGIVITILQVERGRVRVGVEAPRETAIWRAEALPPPPVGTLPPSPALVPVPATEGGAS